MMKRFTTCVFLICAATGCSTAAKTSNRATSFAADGAVVVAIVETAGNQRYEVRAGEQFFRELPSDANLSPIYPAPLLARQLAPVEIVARLVVGSTGGVEKADIVASSTATQDFSDSVLVAVRSWTFVPLKRATGNKIEPLPFTQDYRFTFKQENGRAVVVQGSSQ